MILRKLNIFVQIFPQFTEMQIEVKKNSRRTQKNEEKNFLNRKGK